VESHSNIIDASHAISNYSQLLVISLRILIGSGGGISSFGGFPLFPTTKNDVTAAATPANTTADYTIKLDKTIVGCA
jgi:hypothetical protein